MGVTLFVFVRWGLLVVFLVVGSCYGKVHKIDYVALNNIAIHLGSPDVSIYSQLDICAESAPFFAPALQPAGTPLQWSKIVAAYNIKNVILQDTYQCDLFNGIRVAFTVLSHIPDITFRVEYSYQPQLNMLQGAGSLTGAVPVVYAQRKTIKNICRYDPETKQQSFDFYDPGASPVINFTVEGPEKDTFNFMVVQSKAFGTLPGPIGNILVFSQDGEMFIVKKTAASECSMLRIPITFDTRHFPAVFPRKQLNAPKPGPVRKNLQQNSVVDATPILVAGFVIVFTVMVTRWRLRKKFRQRRKLNQKDKRAKNL